VRFPITDPMLVKARIEGKWGVVREVSSVIDFNSPYCVILNQDAVDIGYSEGGNNHNEEERARPDRVHRFSSMRGIDRGIRIPLHKVSLGGLVARNVDAVVLELEHPRFITFDFVLGRSFLKNFKLTVDLRKGYLSLVKQGGVRTHCAHREVAFENPPNVLGAPFYTDSVE
jgi:hypothetical protein